MVATPRHHSQVPINGVIGATTVAAVMYEVHVYSVQAFVTRAQVTRSWMVYVRKSVEAKPPAEGITQHGVKNASSREDDWFKVSEKNVDNCGTTE